MLPFVSAHYEAVKRRLHSERGTATEVLLYKHTEAGNRHSRCPESRPRCTNSYRSLSSLSRRPPRMPQPTSPAAGARELRPCAAACLPTVNGPRRDDEYSLETKRTLRTIVRQKERLAEPDVALWRNRLALRYSRNAQQARVNDGNDAHDWWRLSTLHQLKAFLTIVI